MEVHDIWIGDMDYEKRRFEMKEGLRNGDMEKNGENQLDRKYHKRRSSDIDTHNKKETKENGLDTYLEEIEEKIDEKKTRKRPRQIMLYSMMVFGHPPGLPPDE